jgi:hypothetical protein
MCGIAGIHVKEAFMGRFPLDRMANALLLGIESRGRDATGYVAVNGDNEIRFQKAPVEASAFIEKKKPIPNDARTVLLHTRYATQGEPSNANNNHPVLYKSCFTVHNGHIGNDDEIFNELGEDFPRGAQVDSEAISALFSYHGFASADDIKTTLESLRGGFAIATIDPEQAPGRLLLAKGPSSPLYVLNHKKAIIWASTERAIEDAWGAVLGTPPKKKAKLWERERDLNGMCSMWQGKAFIIDNDDVEVMDFKSSNFRPYTPTNVGTEDADDWYYYGSAACDTDYERWMDSDDKPNRSASTPGWNRQPGWEKDPTDGWVYNGPRYESQRGTLLGEHIKEWTCKPSYKACEHPCIGGCNSFVNCTCIEGHPDNPGTSTALVRVKNQPGWVEIDKATGVVVEHHVDTYQCDGCDAYVTRPEIATLILGEDTFDLCPPCWEAEGNTSFPAHTEEDQEKKLRKNIWDRALAETAWELNCSTDYVVWILLECPDEQIRNDPDLKLYYEQTAREFENAKAIAHDLLSGVYEGG